MSNIIGVVDTTPIEKCLCMSNGLTNVFINVLLLSGSQIAQTVEEKRLIVWLAEKDQSKVGTGNVGFDICEMPWNMQTFEENRAFLLEVITAAENKIGWEYLGYVPNEELLFPCLKRFAELVSQMKQSNIQSNVLDEWMLAAQEDDPVRCGFPICKKHNTLLTIFGCQICNN